MKGSLSHKWSERDLLFCGCAIRGYYDPSPRRKREQGKEGRRREIRVVVALQGICVGTVKVETVRIGEKDSSSQVERRED